MVGHIFVYFNFDSYRRIASVYSVDYKRNRM